MSTKISSQVAYDNATRKSKGVAVVKCSANWCGPCKRIAPAYESLAQSHPKTRFYSLDIEEVNNFTDYGVVTSLPSFLFFVNGNPAGMITGADLKSVEAHVVKCEQV